jgi:hypothetical protein
LQSAQPKEIPSMTPTDHDLGATERNVPPAPGNDDAHSAAIDESLEETFPASDPPAHQSSDEPPANAEAMRDAARKPQPR